ncbi:MAG: AAA family ATPase [Planctomycetales bacterium]|nr:AAA family ATPase [Planctomycetales bacterium]
MYESFFGFEKRAFSNVPDTSHYFPVHELVAARETIARVIAEGEGPAVVVGPAGVGKTLLLSILEEQFRPEYQTVTLACGQLHELRDMLQTIVHQLRLPHQGQNEGELRLTLLDFLEPSEECPNGLLLLVDEAQHLSVELLEEVRMISNFVRNGSPRVRVVLFGNDRLEDTLTNPKLESLNQRLAARCYLQGMGREETRQYVTGLSSAAGGGLGLWSEDGLRAVFDASHGIPRVVNQVCNQALYQAAQRRARQIDSQIVEQAWGELQQLPTPWTSDAPAETSSSVIEFGGLDEEPGMQTAEPNSPSALEIGPLGEFTTHDSEQAAAHYENSAEEYASSELDPETWQAMVVAQEISGSTLQPEQLVHYEICPEAIECAAKIESRLAEVERHEEAAAPTAAVDDPFGDFALEEIVIDEHIQLGEMRTIGPRVSSLESRLLGETLAAGQEMSATLRRRSSSTRVETEPRFPESHLVNEPPAELNERIREEMQHHHGEYSDGYEPATVVPMFAASRDDRDMIVIEDDPSPSAQNRGVIHRLRGR